jgi:transcriptional regulator with XRE-family HTH domain
MTSEVKAPQPRAVYDGRMGTDTSATRQAASAPCTTDQATPTSFGQHLRAWRLRRHLSQQELAHTAELSTRHLSFLETGRAHPSRDMVLRLAARLHVPLRERNPMLTSAGFAPMYGTRTLDDPDMAAAQQSLALLLRSHEPNPSLVIDRHYNVVATNRAVDLLLQGVDPTLLQAPINVVRLSLHPLGLAPHIVNLAQWRQHILERLGEQCDTTGSPHLKALLDEVLAYPQPVATPSPTLAHEHRGVLLPLQLRTPAGVLSFISTVTVFGTPHDVTLQELAVESFFAADEFTAQVLAQAAEREHNP